MIVITKTVVYLKKCMKVSSKIKGNMVAKFVPSEKDNL